MPKMQKRKAVAPIIATLLLVAIAVVGGIIVFVWASGMFGSTAGTALPNAESLQLIGYDARDTDDAAGLTDFDILVNDNNQALGEDNFLVLKVRNTGVADVLISKVVIMGKDHTWDSAADLATAPGTGEFEVYAGVTDTPDDDKTTASIAPGEDARIAITLDDELPSNISLGRNLQMKIKTEQGSTFNFFVVTGQSE